MNKEKKTSHQTKNQTKTATVVPVGNEEANLLRIFCQLQQKECYNKTGWVSESDFASQQPIHHSSQSEPGTGTHQSLLTNWGRL